MTTIPPRLFYVYVLARPDNRPFYVGKGVDDRILAHEWEARRGHKCHKCSVIRKIWRAGGEIQRYTVFTTNDEAEAYAYEVELIAMYGKGTLTNKATGGRNAASGSCGRRHTAVARARMSAAQQARVFTDEARAKASAAQKANWQDPEYRSKLSVAAKAQKSTAEARAEQSARSKAMWQDPEYRARASAINKARVSSPESRARQSAVIADKMSSPEARARNSAAAKARLENPELRAQIGAAMKDRWNDPAYREKMLRAQNSGKSREMVIARNKANWEDPDYREKMSARLAAQAGKAADARWKQKKDVGD